MAFWLRDRADWLDGRKSLAVYAIDSAGGLTHDDVERVVNASFKGAVDRLSDLARLALLDDYVE